MAPKRRAIDGPARKARRGNGDDCALGIAKELMRFNIPVQQIVAATLNASCAVTDRVCKADLTAASRTETPYGTVCEEIALPLKEGGEIKLYCNNPFALLYAACARSKKFGTFLEKHLSVKDGKLAEIVFYADETTPGNQLRPDKGRSYEAIFFTFKNLPSWFVTRKHGFFKFAFVLSEDVSRIEGGLPRITRAMLYKFFDPESFHFTTTGVAFPTGEGEANVNANFGFFCIDEDASHKIFEVKGAGSSKPCLCCKNIVGARTDASASNYLFHYSEPRRALWDCQTPESFQESKEMLDEAHDNGEDIGELELMLGLKRDPLGLLWDPYIANLIKLPRCMYWDIMHCKFASGGMAQYLLNGFCLELIRNNIELEDLDSFTRDCKGHKLPKNFWSTRVVHKVGAHIKGFASEIVDGVYVLALFCDAVVAKSGKMADHVEAVRRMHEIILITSRANDIQLNLDVWESKEEAYQILHQRLAYGTKPKGHLGRHVVDSARIHEVLFTCWAPERDHHYSKDIAQNCFNNCSKTILDRSNHHFFEDLVRNDDILRETHLVDAVPCDCFQQQLGDDTVVTASTTIMSHVGGLKKGQYVHAWKVSSIVVLKIELFLEVRRRFDPGSHFLLLAEAHVSRGAKTWASSQQVVCTPVDRIVRRDVVFIDPDTSLVHVTV